MNPFEITLAGVAAFWLIAFIISNRSRNTYRSGFRDVATQLYNVTQERNKLVIQNTGLKSELARTCVEKEELQDHISGIGDSLVVRHYFDGGVAGATYSSNQCRVCGLFRDHDIHAVHKNTVSTLKPEHRE